MGSILEKLPKLTTIVTLTLRRIPVGKAASEKMVPGCTIRSERERHGRTAGGRGVRPIAVACSADIYRDEWLPLLRLEADRELLEFEFGRFCETLLRLVCRPRVR